jgi:branched-chain amino acid transport system ATP-binding protein
MLEMRETESILSAHGVAKAFKALVVLRGVNFTIAKGEAIGIVGPNGAGKTTLLNVLSGAYAPSEGQILWRGADVTRLSAAGRCRLGIARSHQIPRPFGGMTVFENLYVAAAVGGNLRGQKTYQRCAESLQLCGMLPLANRRAETLGLLDRKRLEMARALATGPEVLLLDEIGGGLTDAEAAVLVTTIQEICRRGVAVVWIEHIVHILRQVVTRLVCMDAGAILADGTPDAVMSDPAVIAAYLGPGAGRSEAA